MEWQQAFGQEKQPDSLETTAFVSSPLWGELCGWIENTYGVAPRVEYSSCSMQRGWNVKYKKGGRALCTLYPMAGYFIALVVIGEKERFEVEPRLPSFSKPVQKLYQETPSPMGSKWLMIPVKEEDVLKDVQTLIQIRAGR